MSHPYLLVVDDDTRLRQLLKQYLKENDFKVMEAPSAIEADSLVKMFKFDLIVMDVMMPGMNGTDYVRNLRQEGNHTPVLMLTAMGDTSNRIVGLEAGADDYLAKPFEPKELLLRINNILKRVSSKKINTQVSFGNCLFEIRSNTLTKKGTLIPLTGAEADLLKIFIKRPNQVIDRMTLRKLMASDNDRTVDVQITRLRKKIEEEASHPTCIQTIRGQGYMLVTK